MSARGLFRRSIVVIASLGLMGSLAVLGTAGFVRSTSEQHLYRESKVPPMPVALVLGAQVYPDGTPSPYLQSRLDIAQRLYEQGRVKVILVSGDNGTIHYNEPTAMRDYLIGRGVPADKVVADFAGFDTYDSCVRAKKIFGVDRLTIITQSYHLHRAVATCSLVGVQAVGVGDSSGQGSRTWRIGQARELLANFKMLWDVVSRRTPTLGQPETSVTRALGG